MAKVSLRIYNQEIEGLVDRGQLDEAIAHCRHILNAFPKNLETYRLLGKAYLEAKRYGEATDIFERVLMAVPDDFVAHVGMSIINDEQKNMDAAIWHMERAFEVQPSNAAIQSELQRLFGRRDGIEPPKIRLTRGALAHMYVQGELYPQAISEINSVLEEDAGRQDMQVLLARAYFHAGQKGEAAEICSQLLRRYPYNFDANRVLVELLPQTERGESTQVYRHRLSELDPYSTFTTGSVFHTNEVSDAAVNLERLEWDGQAVDLQPEWNDGLGIRKGDSAPTSGNEEPDWLKTGFDGSSFSASTPTSGPASASGGIPIPAADGDDEIPDFMRAAGWGENTGTFQEGLGAFDEPATSDESAEAIVQGDMPDWVKAMAPAGSAQESTPLPASLNDDLSQDDVPDWLQGLGDVQDDKPAEQEPQAEAADLPDWLASMEPAGEAQPESQEEPEEALTVEADIPDWLASMEPEGESQSESQEEPEEALTVEADIPDWLASMEPEDESQAESLEESEVAPAFAAEIPDWLNPIQAEEQAVPDEPGQEIPETTPESLSDWQIDDELSATAAGAGSIGMSNEEQDDAVAWLEGLASKHGAKPEELVTDPNARKEIAPDWVQRSQVEQEQGEPEAVVPQEHFPVEDEPVQPVEDIAASADAGGVGMSMEEQDDAVAWLEGLAANHGAKPEELVTDPNARKETAPDWVQRSQAEQEQEVPEAVTPQEEMPQEEFLAEEEQVQPVEEVVAPESETVMGASAQEQDDAVAWLEGLAAKHGAKPEEMVTDPESRKETAPDWVQKESEAAAEQPVIEEPAPVEETPESEPDWMKHAKEVGESLYAELEDSQTKEPLHAEDTDETGMWLRDMGQEAGFEDSQTEEEPAADENISDWLAGLDTDELDAKTAPETEASPEPEIEAEPDVPDWLRGLETESAEPAPVDEKPVEEAADKDLPSWLSGLDDDVAQEKPAEADGSLPKWLDVDDEQEPAPPEPEPITAVDWKPVEEIEPSPLEELLGSGSTPEPPPSAPIQPEPRPQSKQPEPKPEPSVPAGRPAYMEPVTRSRSGMTGMLSAAQEPLLVQAQNELTRSNIPAAMDSYGKLIKKGKMLEEVIFDLREALYRYPVEVSIMQTLGDAYMRANRLQDALDAYTKAEELLR